MPTVHVSSISIPHEMRGDNAFPNYFDYYLNRGHKMQVHTIIGPAMAAIAYNRGFHTYDDENLSNYTGVQDDLLQHSIRAQSWYHEQSPLNAMLRTVRPPVKFIKLGSRVEYTQQGPTIVDDSDSGSSSEGGDDEKEEDQQYLTSERGRQTIARYADKASRDYDWLNDPRNTNSYYGRMYNRAGVPNPYAPTGDDWERTRSIPDQMWEEGRLRLMSPEGQAEMARHHDRTLPTYNVNWDPAVPMSETAMMYAQAGVRNPYIPDDHPLNSDLEYDKGEEVQKYINSAIGQRRMALAASRNRIGYHWDNDPRNPDSVFARKYVYIGEDNPWEKEK